MAVENFNNTTPEGTLVSTHATYLTAAESGTISTPSWTYHWLGQTLTYDVEQVVLSFDTSTLPDDATISDAVLSIFLQNDKSLTDFVVEAYAKNIGATINTGDWVAQSAIGGLPYCASLSTVGGLSATLQPMVSEAGMAGAINKTGLTQFVLISSKQRLLTQPSTVDEVGVYKSSSSNFSTLSVTYTPGAAGFTGLTVTRLLQG